MDPEAVEARLKAAGAAHPGIQRYALVDDDGEPVIQARANGQRWPALYGTKRGARVGCSRWGGRIWDRQKGTWA